MKIIILVLSLMITTGCSHSGSAIEVSDGWGSGNVELITLTDGTKCAVLIGMYKGAISCDWKNI